ncbi:hypothetical protein [Halomarina pelagica]|uniref:hypothetical protein n=1 Tax=Halomarina pelagica TaxID=2961599 RepID=UPI0020C24F0E|nr:hypothetical protein [Halomarina sp. BND7]
MPVHSPYANLAVLAAVLAAGALVTLSVSPAVAFAPIDRPTRATTLGGLVALLGGCFAVAVAGSTLGSR